MKDIAIGSFVGDVYLPAAADHGGYTPIPTGKIIGNATVKAVEPKYRAPWNGFGPRQTELKGRDGVESSRSLKSTFEVGYAPCAYTEVTNQ